jgi:hypothetical protein
VNLRPERLNAKIDLACMLSDPGNRFRPATIRLLKFDLRIALEACNDLLLGQGQEVFRACRLADAALVPEMIGGLLQGTSQLVLKLPPSICWGEL